MWLNDSAGGGAAGSFYYDLEFTNLSGRACTLTGYPGVSAVTLGGARIGAPARREPVATTGSVRLGAGASAVAILRIADAGNFEASACRGTLAAGLRVFPPGQTVSRLVPFPFETCSSSAVATLSVRAMRRA